MSKYVDKEGTEWKSFQKLMILHDQQALIALPNIYKIFWPGPPYLHGRLHILSAACHPVQQIIK